MMYIYKITNLINNKVYIGKTTRSIEKRWNNHINDAISNRLSTPLSHAIRKYQCKNFSIEQIDSTTTEQELNQKEIYWINKYDSTNKSIGYNLCLGGEGGNTYAGKSDEDMNIIKKKLSKSKLGKQNPHASAVKCRNIETGIEYHFHTVKEMKEFFNETQHNFITRRCLHKTRCLYKEKWQIAYENESYNECTKEKNNHRARHTLIKNGTQWMEFKTFNDAEKYFHLRKGLLSKMFNKYGSVFEINNKNIVVYCGSVSTISDECMRVGLDISTSGVIGNESPENRSGRL